MNLSPRMPDLAALEVLLAVADKGSLSGAGRALGLTQQAVSGRVAAIEAQTGVRLVTRSAHGSHLTSAGVVAVQWADRLLQVAREVDAGLATLRHNARSRLRISASLTVAEQLLPGWLVSLQAAAEAREALALDIVLTAANTNHVIEAVRAGGADVGFIEGPRVPRGLRSQVVASDRLVVVVRPDHRWARRSRALSAEELSATPLVTREAGSGTREFLSDALSEVLGRDRAQASPALELSTAAAVRAAVMAGSAPAVMSDLAIGDDLAAGRLRAVPVPELDLHRKLRAIWSGPRTPPAGAVRNVLSHIAALKSSPR